VCEVATGTGNLWRVVIQDLSTGHEDAIIDISHLFDGDAKLSAVRRFLTEQGHHLLVAYEDDEPAGFVTGIEMTHPDKGTEMFLYELAVGERFRRRGIGTALVGALGEKARGAGCYGMWVLTDTDNAAANQTYMSAGGGDPKDQTMWTWTFTRP
jgi:ribosomal protein S18 acetylase RimI-like enzyme